MLDNIPLDIQVEIMKRLPVKSLIRFRSLSKSWKSSIGSPYFVASYSSQGTQVQHLFLVNTRPGYHSRRNKYFLIAEDDSFPQHKVSVPLPASLVEYGHMNIHGCSNGLLCFSEYYQLDRRRGTTCNAVLWNPSIRKAVDVVVPNIREAADIVVVPNIGYEVYVSYESNLGFGVCRETMDPKIVKIRCIEYRPHIEYIASIPWQVEVFTLSTGAWRSLYSNLPRKSIQFDRFQTALEVDGFLYWLATDRIAANDGFIAADDGFRSCNLIVSFDLTSEEFKEINLPDSLAYEDHITRLSMYKLRESLAILHESRNDDDFDIPLESRINEDHLYTVWTMEDGVPKSFTNRFNLETPEATLRGFRKDGEPVIEIHDNDRRKVAVYDPQSKQINNIGIDGSLNGFQVFPYMETMLLLDHPGSVLYSDV